MTIGDRIKAARKKAGKTQTELAKKIGITQATYNQWERGIRNPKVESLKKIAVALDIPFTTLILEDENERSNTMSKDDTTNSMTALGMALGVMGRGNIQPELNDTHKEADKACLKALGSIAETMDALNNLIKSVETSDDFGHDNIVDLSERMSRLATSMSTLRMSMGLGFSRGMNGTP